MKIGINALFLAKPYTGIGQYTLNLIKALSEIDKENEYLIVVNEDANFNFGKNFKKTIIPYKNFPLKGLRKTYFEQIQVPQFFKSEKVNLAHFLYPCNPRFSFNIKTIVTVHDCIPWISANYRSGLLSDIYHWNSRKSLEKADLIITVSNTIKNELLEKYNLKPKIETVYESCSGIYNGENDPKEFESVKKKYNLKNEFLLYVGGFDERKNVKNLIDAFVQSKLASKNIDLVLAGDKSLNTDLYKSYDYSPSEFQENIKKIGFVEENELKSLYNNCLAFINISSMEGFNIPLLEAANGNAPIITSGIPVHQEILGDSAIFVDQNNLSEISQAMMRIAKDENLRIQLKEKALKQAEKYSWPKTAEKILELYKKLINLRKSEY